ncbi:hypothetical protein [Schleiferilactobacillus shenzhenensis]|uniref:Uncharacterized protein n=1 Tax=Schleiferilactobacillus shenzhenensis LY-73 TaxID=1231336 RepID=U4TTV1_9LACO|nr:hypothetical protein [Schleiferilactobacillus shenzhenensis]ERL64862.1 hypothetical protein L248_0466 [Schleiferilactobacillus shenzhenensis LY-73]
MTQIKDIVPVELVNRAASTPIVKTKLGVKVRFGDAEVLLYNGIDGYLAHIILQEMTGNAARPDQR